MATNSKARWRASQNQSSDEDGQTLIDQTDVLLGKKPRPKPTVAKARPRATFGRIIIEPVMNTPLNVVNMNIGAERSTFQLVPSWFQPIDRNAVLRNTIYPRNTTDRRPYDTIACYRSVIGKSTDFNNEPLQMDVQSPETLMLSLDSFAQQFGGQLSFTNRDLSFTNSVEQMASGIANMGSVHLLATDSLPTAVFNMKVKLDYKQDLARSAETMQNFALGLSTTIARTLGCSQDYVRTLSVTASNRDPHTSNVELALSLPDSVQTAKYAQALQTMPKDRWAKDKLLKYIKPDQLDYKWQSVLSYLELKASDFDPRYNNNYTPEFPAVLQRGNQPYHLPIGWFRHGLNMQGKYADDDVWLGDSNKEGEWPVAFHGTHSGAVSNIAQQGLSPGTAQRDAMKKEAVQQLGSTARGVGLYLATHCDGGSHPQYTRAFSAEKDGRTGKFYVVFQCRVRPNSYSIHTGCVKEGKAWRVIDPTAIRPYGLLLKKDE